jgi:P-type E1-E2 ATPase
MTHEGIAVDLPGRGQVVLTTLALDFTGTLAKDGALLPGVAEAFVALAARLRIVVLTADTFGTAAKALEGLPVEVRIVATGAEKAEYLRSLKLQDVVAVGNGRNDVEMLRAAGLAIAVVGPEGAAGALLRVADVVVRDVHDALDLLVYPLRLKATLRD